MCVIPPVVKQNRQFLVPLSDINADTLIEIFQRRQHLACARLSHCLAPFHLLHQEFGRHRVVIRQIDTEANQFEQIQRPRKRLSQRHIGFVHFRRPLQGASALRLIRISETIRVHLRLNCPIALVKQVHIDTECARQTQEGKVIGVEIHNF